MTKARSITLKVLYQNAAVTAQAAGGDSGGAGQTVTLDNTPLYISSTALEPAAYKTGVYYLYDGAVINGRRRITNLLSRVGKEPAAQNVTGWVNEADCKGAGAATPAAQAVAMREAGTDIAQYVESLTYTDSAADASDSIDIRLDAQEESWLYDRMPVRGAVLWPRIIGQDWGGAESSPVMRCGSFVVDDISFSDTPSVMRLGGVSKPENTDFSELEREYVWMNTSIKRIGSTIAARYGLGFGYDAEDYDIECDEQEGTDSSYYNTLCKNYGLILKVYASRMWVYDREQYKKKPSAAAVDREQIKRGSFSYSTTLFGTYTGGFFNYTDPDTDCDIYCSVGGGNHTKSVNRRASSVFDASVQLCAELNNANHGQTKISFAVDGAWRINAACNIKLTGYGSLDGKYFVDKAVHTVSRGGGFETRIEASKVLPGFNHWEVGGNIEYLSPEEESAESYSSEATAPAENAASSAAGVEAGDSVALNDAPFYVSSAAKDPSCRKTGVFYFYDGILINGRYRVTNSADRCGKLPIGQNVTGWVPVSHCGSSVSDTK